MSPPFGHVPASESQLDALVATRIGVVLLCQGARTALAGLGMHIDELVDLLGRKQLTMRSFVPLLPATLALRLRLLRLADAT